MKNTIEWFKPTDRLPDRQPKVSYSQVACLVLYHGEVLIRMFNHEHMCWDQEDGDDHFCEIGAVSLWALLPYPETNKP